MKPKFRAVLDLAIEYGVAIGVSRAFKHTDSPTQDQIRMEVERELVTALHEWFDFEDRIVE